MALLHNRYLPYWTILYIRTSCTLCSTSERDNHYSSYNYTNLIILCYNFNRFLFVFYLMIRQQYMNFFLMYKTHYYFPHNIGFFFFLFITAPQPPEQPAWTYNEPRCCNRKSTTTTSSNS